MTAIESNFDSSNAELSRLKWRCRRGMRELVAGRNNKGVEAVLRIQGRTDGDCQRQHDDDAGTSAG